MQSPHPQRPHDLLGAAAAAKEKGAKRQSEDEPEQNGEEKLTKIRCRCFKCGKMGHYADKCPESDSTAAGEAPTSAFKASSGPKKGKGKGKDKDKDKDKGKKSTPAPAGEAI